MSIRFDTIVNKILYIEKKFDLINFQICGVYVWQAARVKVYLEITNKVIENNQSGFNKKHKIKFKDLLRRIFINSILFNPFLSIKKNEILIFESGRKYFDQGKYIDIYTIDLYNNFTSKNVSCALYETNYQSDTKNRNFKTKHLDFIYLFSKLNKPFIRPKLSASNINFITDIENEIEHSFGVKISLLNLLIEEIKVFKSQYPLYKKLFKQKNPREIYITNSCDKPSLVSAAKDLNIIVNELQHGLITQEDLVAHFPDVANDSLAYFPNRFFLWKDLNMCTSKLPLSKENIKFIDCKYLQRWKDQTSNLSKESRTILVISQPFCSAQIQSYIENNIAKMKDFQFLYKIHPSEDITAMEYFIERMSQKYQNITFYNKEQSVYWMMQKSSYVIGIFSTALFEAPHFRCNVFLLDLPGAEIASSLIKSGSAKLINSSEPLINHINICNNKF